VPRSNSPRRAFYDNGNGRLLGLAQGQRQPDSSRQQRRQSAREIYREFVKLSIEKPDLAAPDYCAIKTSETLKDDTEYENFIEFQLYASEQILAELPEWEATMDKRLAPHTELLCSEESWSGDTDDVRAMIGRFRKSSCAGFKSACADTEDAMP
jgi:hypothetical protein